MVAVARFYIGSADVSDYIVASSPFVTIVFLTDEHRHLTKWLEADLSSLRTQLSSIFSPADYAPVFQKNVSSREQSYGNFAASAADHREAIKRSPASLKTLSINGNIVDLEIAEGAHSQIFSLSRTDAFLLKDFVNKTFPSNF